MKLASADGKKKKNMVKGGASSHNLVCVGVNRAWKMVYERREVTGYRELGAIRDQGNPW